MTQISSVAATATATAPLVTGWVFSSCAVPATDVLVAVTDYAFDQGEMSAAHYALGASLPTVISDVVGGRDGTVAVQTFDDSTYNALRGLLLSQATLWLSSPFGFGRYVRAGLAPGSSASTSGGGGSPLPVHKGGLDPQTGAARVRNLSIQFVEQPRP